MSISASGKVLTTLLNDVRACKICADFLPLGPRPVLQVSPSARILIVGQAPGSKVHKTGIPFDDPSGDRLRGWMGVDNETFYDATRVGLVPMGLCYPGTGKSGDLPPRPECAVAWRAKLLDCMPMIQLTLVIGQYAQAWHLAGATKDNLTETVKAWREYWPAKLPLPHPSPRNNIWLKRNDWFEKEVTPVLKDRVRQILL